MEPTGIIFDIKRFAIHDGPGIRTTVFLKGCPLDCAWCHNPESRTRSPEPRRGLTGRFHGINGMIGREATVESVMDVVSKDGVFYEESGGGMTLSGGEPLLQPEFAAALLRAARDEGIHTAVDTSGSVSWRHIEAVLPWTDLFLYDVKIADPELHAEWVGGDHAMILANLSRLAESEAALRVRVPLIPRITDTDDNLAAIASVIESLPGIDAIDLLAYNPAGEHKTDRLGFTRRLPPLSTQSDAELDRIRRHFDRIGTPVFFGGAT